MLTPRVRSSVGAATYAAKLYPYLRPDQRVVLLPWAADCEEGCRAHAAIAPAPDMRVLPNAHDHWAWAQDDHKVVGLFVYRLKNIWQQAGTSGADVCDNPSGTGLGLVDRCANGTAAMPRALAFYQALLLP